MRFIGCAPAWRPGETKDGTSCLVVLDERGSIIGNAFAGSAAQIAGVVQGNFGGDLRAGVLVGVDAPLSVPNERGTRKIERVLSRLSIPAYSASRRMFGDRIFTEEILAGLQEIGVEYTDYLFPRESGSRVVEVDSAATLKILSLEQGAGRDTDLQARLKEVPEPRFRKGNKESRASALKAAIAVLWDTRGLRLRTGNLSGDLSSPENVDISRLDVTPELSHAELDRIVGLIEGTLAAYTVHRRWRGRDGSVVVGVGDEGSVLLPASEDLQRLIAEECRQAKVAYA